MKNIYPAQMPTTAPLFSDMFLCFDLDAIVTFVYISDCQKKIFKQIFLKTFLFCEQIVCRSGLGFREQIVQVFMEITPEILTHVYQEFYNHLGYCFAQSCGLFEHLI